MEQPLYGGLVALKVGDSVVGSWALPSWDHVSVGRLPRSGIHIANSWVPSRLCRFLPWEQGWLVQLGRARAVVRSKYLDDVTFRRRSIVALQPGRSRISFPELDDHLQLLVVIGAGQGEGLPVAEDQRDLAEETGRTAYAAAHVDLTELQRRTVAVTFRHLMVREPTPANLAATAAARLGTTSANVTMTLQAVRSKVNKERWLNLEKNDQLGHYLVQLTRTITWDDLPPELQAPLPG